MNEKDIAKVFSSFRCPNCKERFEQNDIQIVRSGHDGLVVAQFHCNTCEKCFGVAFLGLCDTDIENSARDENCQITIDDVIDAHKDINNLDKNWADFIKDRKPTI